MDSSGWFSLHTHSRYSTNDAMAKVPDMVDKAVELGYPALGLTDHGTPSGSVDLYKSCRKAGIEPMPGMEIYLNADRSCGDRSNYHLTVVAYSEKGYRNLIKMNNQAQRQFFYKPMLDIADLAEMSEDGRTEGLLVSTGCYFGLAQQLIVHQGPEAAAKAIAALAGWFPKVYVELHNHGVVHLDAGYTDASMAGELVDIADELGLPYIVALDSHYIHAAEQRLHDSLKGLVTWSEDPNEAQFPGGPYSMEGADSLRGLFPDEVVARAVGNLGELAAATHVRLPELESFALKVPDVTAGDDPDRVLAGRIDRALADYPYKSMAQRRRFAARAMEELETITAATMAGYILLVADVCDFMLEKGIWFQARGSAGGSLITMLLKITQVDPLDQGLLMERFMSKDRTRPPDIDLDVEKWRRDEVVAYLRSRFSVLQVGSYMKYSLMPDENEEDSDKGSLLRRYYTSQRKRGLDINTWGAVPTEDQAILRDLSEMDLLGGWGTHAAGFIVAPSEESLAQLPLVWMAGPKKFNTAYDKKGVEALGFTKLDLLGLRNLTSRRITLEAICDNDLELRTPAAIWDDIPNKDKEVTAALADGNTRGIFQLDGFTNTRGAKEMKPTSANDCVAMQALYRPALLQAGDDKRYLRRRRGSEPVPVRHDDIAKITGETYGILLYQEQIISLLRMAGMPPDELTDTLDAVKASNAATAAARVFFDKTLPRINQLVSDRGWSQADMDWFLGGLKGYAEYSFNKAHSAQYGIAAWRSAWLSVHYPVEFWLGVLTANEDHKKIKGLVTAARRVVRVRPPHVNYSGASYRLDQSKDIPALRQGFTAIAHIGPATAAELAAKQPFTSLRDLGERCLPSRVSGSKDLALGKSPKECPGAIKALYMAGALDGLT